MKTGRTLMRVRVDARVSMLFSPSGSWPPAATLRYADRPLIAGATGGFPPEPGPGQLAVDSCATYDSGRPFGSLSRSGMTADEFRKCLHRGAGGRVYDERPVLWYPLDWLVLASFGR